MAIPFLIVPNFLLPMVQVIMEIIIAMGKWSREFLRRGTASLVSTKAW